MELKYIASAILGISGGVLTLEGFLSANPSHINLGIAGLFLSIVVLVLKSSKYIKKDAVDIILESYRGTLRDLVSNLKLEGNSVYLPPYENLPEGGIFIPLHRDFEIDPARFDENTFFITDVPDEKSMGILITSLGADLLKRYEEHLEGPITSVPEVESAAGSVLKALNLARKVYVEENEDSIRVVVSPEVSCNLKGCEKVPCPICASILLGLAKATNNLIGVEGFEKKDYGIEIKAKKLGGIEEWM